MATNFSCKIRLVLPFLSGNIPTTLEKLTELTLLDLSGNQLSGESRGLQAHVN